MTANIKVTSDESALSRLYLWLLSLNDETLTAEKQSDEDTPDWPYRVGADLQR